MSTIRSGSLRHSAPACDLRYSVSFSERLETQAPFGIFLIPKDTQSADWVALV